MPRRMHLVALIVLGWSVAAGAGAQTVPSIAYPAPRAFPGFTHPDIDRCRTIDPGHAECIAPANVAGHYMVDAVGRFSSKKPNPLVAMNIVVGDQVCIFRVFQPSAGFNGHDQVHLVCEITLATDAPTTLSVAVEAKNATLDPDGPRLKVISLPWDGVISLRGADGGADAPPVAAPAPTPAPAKTKTPAPGKKPAH